MAKMAVYARTNQSRRIDCAMRLPPIATAEEVKRALADASDDEVKRAAAAYKRQTEGW